jgi:hypothetical protein
MSLSTIVTEPFETLLIAAPPDDAGRRVARQARLDDVDAAARDGRGRGQRAGGPLVRERVVVVDAAADLGREAVEHVHVVEGQQAGRPVLDRAAALLGVALADGEGPEGHVAGGRVDLEEPVDAARLDRRAGHREAAVDDRRAGARALDDDRVRDVVVAGAREVLVQRRDLELERAGGQLDDVLADEGVRLLDRRTQGAGPGGGLARAVAYGAIGPIGRVVDGDRNARHNRSRRPRARERDEHAHEKNDRKDSAGDCPHRRRTHEPISSPVSGPRNRTVGSSCVQLPERLDSWRAGSP